MKKFLLSALLSLGLLPCMAGTFYPKPSGSFRIVTYNVGSLSKYVEDSTPIVAAMIREACPDLVGLNELDSMNTRHNVNQAAELARSAGKWQWFYGRAMAYKGGAYGNAALVPRGVRVERSCTLPLPAAGGRETRSAVVVETDRYVFAVCHLQHRSDSARMVQAQIINDWFTQKYAGCSKPVFFCGDMNARPGSGPVVLLSEKWEVISSMEESIPSSNPKRCIDYIFHLKDSAPVQVLGSHTMTRFRKADPKLASDHLPVYVDVKF